MRHILSQRKPNVSATAWFITLPCMMFIPDAISALSAAARSIPFDAICLAYGKVTLQSAYVLVRPTAPGMFVTQ
jgi:hypothetical protein